MTSSQDQRLDMKFHRRDAGSWGDIGLSRHASGGLMNENNSVVGLQKKI